MAIITAVTATNKSMMNLTFQLWGRVDDQVIFQEVSSHSFEAIAYRYNVSNNNNIIL